MINYGITLTRGNYETSGPQINFLVGLPNSKEFLKIRVFLKSVNLEKAYLKTGKKLILPRRHLGARLLWWIGLSEVSRDNLKETSSVPETKIKTLFYFRYVEYRSSLHNIILDGFRTVESVTPK